MEDQQDVVGQGGNSPSESLVGNMGSGNKGSEAFEEGDGGEIMVEIVGSDVYVHGISGDNIEGDEVGDLEDKIDDSQIHSVSEDIDINKVTDSVVGKEITYISLCKSVDADADVINVANDEGWNPEIIANVSKSDVVESSESEEKTSEDEAVDKDKNRADLVIPEPTCHPTEAVAEVADTEEEKKEVSSSSVTDEGKSTADDTIDNCTDLITPECHPVEAATNIAADIEEGKKEASTTNDSVKCVAVYEVEKSLEDEAVYKNSADLITPETHTSEAVPGINAVVIRTEKSSEGEAIDEDCADIITHEPTSHPAEAVPEIAPVVISEEKTTEDEGIGKDCADIITPEPGNLPEAVSAKADIKEEEKEVLSTTDKFVNHDADSLMAHDESEEAQGEIPHNHNGESLENVLVDSVAEDESYRAKSELATTEGDGGMNKKSFDDEVLASESKNSICESDCQVSSGQDENQDSVVELHGTTNEIDDRFDDVIDADPESIHESSSTGNDDLETHNASENQVASDKRNQLPDSGVVNNDNIGSESVTTTLQTEVVNGDGSCLKGEEIQTDDDPADNMPVDEVVLCSKAEKEDLMAAEKCDLPQTETSNHEVGKIEDINLMQNEVAGVSDSADVCIPPERTEKEDSIEKSSEEENGPGEFNDFGTSEEEQESDKSKLSTEETLKQTSSFRMSQSSYLTPPENEGSFALSDLVWGKVRSHPWWPGQIFDPDDASENAVKHHKKDSYLVAYFGDQTFAWNDSSALKPFRPYFTQIEKHSSSEAFHNAVTCALEEVERRVELGLSCSCTPKDVYAKIETQVVENTGIKEEASQRFGVDRSTKASCFEPDKFIEYISGLAIRTSAQPDWLDLVIARAQLASFSRFKGYRSLTEFPSLGKLHESDEKVSDNRHKCKHDDREYSPDDEDEFGASDVGELGKKRKALNSLEGSEKRVTVHTAKVITSAGQASPKPSFKIGECIRRVASQLKSSNDEIAIDGSLNINQEKKQSVAVSIESLSVSEMLSRIEQIALNPKKRHILNHIVRAFFLGFRNSALINRRGRKKKSEGGSGEEFEFDDVNDSYWTDRIVQNYPEEGQNGNCLPLVPFTVEKPIKTGRKPHSRKRFSSEVLPSRPTKEDENVKRRKQETSPAELILSFTERNHIPTEINLNKMFRRFGPLMESETAVDLESGCAKVIFKRGSDAEVARNSGEKFSIFGPVLVNYQIGYSPVTSVKILPAVPQMQEDDTLMV